MSHFVTRVTTHFLSCSFAAIFFTDGKIIWIVLHFQIDKRDDGWPLFLFLILFY